MNRVTLFFTILICAFFFSCSKGPNITGTWQLDEQDSPGSGFNSKDKPVITFKSDGTYKIDGTTNSDNWEGIYKVNGDNNKLLMTIRKDTAHCEINILTDNTLRFTITEAHMGYMTWKRM